MLDSTLQSMAGDGFTAEGVQELASSSCLGLVPQCCCGARRGQMMGLVLHRSWASDMGIKSFTGVVLVMMVVGWFQTGVEVVVW